MQHVKARRRTFGRAAALTACLILCVPLSAAAQSADEAALRALLEKFSAAYQAGDFEGLMALWSKDSPDLEAGREAIRAALVDRGKFELKSPAAGPVTIDGGKASARLTFEPAGAGGGAAGAARGPAKVNRTAHFVKEGASWKVWRYAPSEEELAAELIRAGAGAEVEALLKKEEALVTAELVSALNRLGRPLYARSEFDRALAVYDLALALAERIGDKRGASGALRQIGNIQGARAAYTQSLESYRRSLKLAEELGDGLGVAAALNNMGHVLDSMGDLPQALEHYQKSLAIAGEIQHRELLTLLHNNIGVLYKTQGDAMGALDYILRSLKLAEESKDRASISRALHNIGIVHASQGNYEQAQDYYQQSLRIEEELGGRENIPKILGNMGLAHAARGNYALALEYHEKALRRAEEIGDQEVIAGSLNNIGSVYGDRGEYGRALEHFRKGLELAEVNGNKETAADARRHIGEAYLLLGEYRKAAEYADQSAALAEQSGFPGLLWSARTVSGKARLALKEYEPARRSLLDAIETVERLRGQVAGGEQDRQRFFERRVAPYYAMVDLMLARRDDFQALAYAERAKGRVLVDVLSGGRVNINKAMTAEELARERALNGEANALNSQIYRETSAQRPDPARLKELDARLRRARLEYESFQTNLYAAHPELKLRRGQAPTLTEEQLGDLLPDAGTALLEFVVGKDVSYLFALTGGAGRGARGAVELKTYRLDIKSEELAVRVNDFRRRLAERNLDFHGQARQLYSLLLEPAREQLRGKTLVCIVPDGVLWELPFQALQPRDGAYLVEDHALFYAPSLSVLHGMRRLTHKGQGRGLSSRGGGAEAARHARRSPRTAPAAAAPPSHGPVLLAFGNPALGQQTIDFVKSVYRDERLGPLPEAEREVKELEKFYTPSRSKIYVGAHAREERVKAEGGDYPILHFATHGVLDDRNPMYSHVLLSRDGGGAQEDGLLHAWEIMNLDLKAEMVVLSACQTARGRLGAGEGVIGMSWALFVAGSPTTVVSLWKVESSSTTQLMTEFHRNLVAAGTRGGAGPRKAEALRAASLKLMKDSRFRHPFYWAGFVMTGDGM